MAGTKLTPTLHTLQKTFQQIIRSSLFEPSDESNLKGFFEEDPGFPLEKRLRIYSESWFPKIFENLAQDYELLFEAMGKANFTDLVKAYLKAYPCRSYSLDDAGDHIPEFLPHWDNSNKQPWYFDLAKIEQAFYKSVYATDPFKWDLTSYLQNSPEESERLALVTESSVFLIQSQFHFEQTLVQGKMPPTRNQHDQCNFLIYRKNFEVKFKPISIEEFKILSQIEQKITLGSLIDLFPSEHTVHLLNAFAQDGIIKPAFDSHPSSCVLSSYVHSPCIPVEE